MANTTNSSTGNKEVEWSITNDIYSIVDAVDNLKKRYVEDENETTLALGIFGFIGDTEAKKIQTNVVIAGELGNEMFPQRAKLDKNIITHAMNCNVEHINAVPATIVTNLMLKEEDLDMLMQDNEFILDHTCPIYIEDYEFHLDYDVLIKRIKNTKREDESWTYTATYIGMEDKNPLSNLVNPYLANPFRIYYDNYFYISTQCTIRQVTIEETIDKLITDSLIENKSYVFTFENQLADFKVYVTEKGITRILTPIPYGGAINIDTTNYCWYMYIDESTIRITFDTASYIPGLNADIRVLAYTTLGNGGNFKSRVAENIDEEGYFIDFESVYYKYKTITIYVRPASNSTGGYDRKSIEELQRLIPKMAMSRGYITTETDLNNYFNLISTEDNRLKLQKKVDNQLQRIWYCYMVVKDEYNNVVPTNTLPIRYDFDPSETVENHVIPAGTTFIYDKDVGYAKIIDPAEIPEPYSDEYFENPKVYYYKLLYTIIIKTDPLICSYRMNLADKMGYFIFDWMNLLTELGFLVNTYRFRRRLLEDNNTYTFDFGIQQSIAEDFGLYTEYEDVETGHTVVINNMKVFMVLYQEGEPYRYVEGALTSADTTNYIFKWRYAIHTNNDYDVDGKLCITNVHEVSTGVVNPGYIPDNVTAKVFLYAKFDTDYGRHDADNIIPDMEGWSLVNIYEVEDGLNFCNNFTNVMNTRVRRVLSEDGTRGYYDITGIPFVGDHYFEDEDHVSYLINRLLERKAYIDNCLQVLENNMDIDFKYYNTYGYSETYTIGDKEQTSLGNIDITMKFRVKLANANDSGTRGAIIQFIKEYIEDLNDTGDLHIPNLLHDIKEYFGDTIVYIEFMNFNNNRLGVNHIELRDIEDPHTVPEFISVRNQWNVDHTALIPCIDLEVVV